MRALGITAVLLSLALTTGGVSYRSQAGSDAQAQSAERPQRPGIPNDLQTQCRIDEGASRVVNQVKISERARNLPNNTRPLSGSGYNYSRPGLWQPQPTGSPPSEEAASPEQLEDAPPASSLD